MRTLASLALGAAVLGAALVAQAGSGKGGGKSEAWAAYGDKVTMKKITTLGAIARDRSRVTGKEILTRGVAIEVCRNKGCWMTVADGGREVRVEFEDYGFFVPWDAEGRKVRMQGVLQERMMSAEERRHIADESKRGAGEVIDGPKKTFVFVASAVEILGGGEISAAQREVIEGRPPKTPGDGHGHGHDHR